MATDHFVFSLAVNFLSEDDVNTFSQIVQASRDDGHEYAISTHCFCFTADASQFVRWLPRRKAQARPLSRPILLRT